MLIFWQFYDFFKAFDDGFQYKKKKNQSSEVFFYMKQNIVDAKTPFPPAYRVFIQECGKDIP